MICSICQQPRQLYDSCNSSSETASRSGSMACKRSRHRYALSRESPRTTARPISPTKALLGVAAMGRSRKPLTEVQHEKGQGAVSTSSPAARCAFSGDRMSGSASFSISANFWTEKVRRPIRIRTFSSTCELEREAQMTKRAKWCCKC